MGVKNNEHLRRNEWKLKGVAICMYTERSGNNSLIFFIPQLFVTLHI